LNTEFLWRWKMPVPTLRVHSRKSRARRGDMFWTVSQSRISIQRARLCRGNFFISKSWRGGLSLSGTVLGEIIGLSRTKGWSSFFS